MSARVLAALALSFLALGALPSGQASRWTQWGGDARHAGNLPALGAESLDVVAHLRITPSGQLADSRGPGIIDTPGGPLALVSDGGACHLVRVADAARGTIPDVGAPFACPEGARLAGGDLEGQRVAVCIDGASSSDLLQVIETAGGVVLWKAAPTLAAPDVLNPPVPLPLPTPPVQTPVAAGTWRCGGAAYDPDSDALTLAFASDAGRHHIESFAMGTGKLRWGLAVPITAFGGQGDPTNGTLPAATEASGEFVPTSVTLTDTGFVVAGRVDGATGNPPPGLAWLDRDGHLKGAYVGTSSPSSPAPGVPALPSIPTVPSLPSSPSNAPSANAFPAAIHATARGNVAAQVLGNQVVLVNPQGSQSVSDVGNTAFSAVDLAGAAWGRNGILLATESQVVLVDDFGNEVARWSGLDGGRVQQVIALDGQFLVLIARATPTAPAVDLLHVGVPFPAGEVPFAPTLDRIPLPLQPSDPTALHVHLTPLADGRILAWESGGDAVVLAHQAIRAGTGLTLSDAYPQEKTPVQADIGTPSDANTTMLLAWGDGTLEGLPVAPGALLGHAFPTTGDHAVRLLTVFPDGLTSTTTVTAHVGGRALERPNLFTTLFDSEHQNYTFFVLGILLTLVGAAVTAVAAIKGRRRLERFLVNLDRIRDAGRSEPLVAIRDLHGYRRGLRVDLASGHLSDAQYSVLDSQVRELLRGLRQRILGSFVGRVSDNFRHALDGALFDGVIEDRERAQLATAAAKEEGLSPTERANLVRLVQSWRIEPAKPGAKAAP